MQIIKQIRWSREDRHYFGQLDKWLSLTSRLDLTEEECKAASRIARGADLIDEPKLVESMEVWQKLREVMEDQKISAEKTRLEISDVADSLIFSPKQAMTVLIEAADQAMKDIDKAMELSRLALALLKDEELNIHDIIH